MKKYNTPKLFYKLYPYKIQWYSHFASYFRGDDLAYCREVLDQHHRQLKNNKVITIVKWRETVKIPITEFYKAQKVYQTLCRQSNYKIRVEHPMLTIYSTDRRWLYNLAKDIDADEWWEPSVDLQPDVLIMGPKMAGWEFKITLGGNVPAGCYDWAEANLDKLKIGNKLRRFINNRQRYLSGYYFYVRSEKMLSLATIVLGGGIQRIDKIVIEDTNA